MIDNSWAVQSFGDQYWSYLAQHNNTIVFTDHFSYYDIRWALREIRHKVVTM